MKKSVFRFLVAVAAVVAIGFAVAGCKTRIDETGGVLTLTGIPPEYEGKWVSATFSTPNADGKEKVEGYLSLRNDGLTRVMKLPKIEDGKVSIPMWNYDPLRGRYVGNITADVQFRVYSDEDNTTDLEEGVSTRYYASEEIGSVTFTNGSATAESINMQPAPFPKAIQE
jgi:hypothetical protein